MEAFRGRTIDTSKRVKVYRNLHKRCFSIVQGGLVVAYADTITLNNVLFKVSEAGRQRVIREKQKNVHAYVTGLVGDNNNAPTFLEITYNPYKRGEFYNKQTDEEVSYTDQVIMTGGKCYFA
jgi:hypothetical protein